MVLTQQYAYDEVCIELEEFPYHYGSHATRASNARRARPEVSIPLWFSRNTMEDGKDSSDTSFPYHYGSHATKTKWHYKVWYGVSIPLWFSRNFVHLIQLFCYSPFPYHYGSHATVSADGKPWSFDPFPYHYGSHEEEPSSTQDHGPVLRKSRRAFQS